MKFTDFFDERKRSFYSSTIKKRTIGLFSKPIETKPIFLFGKQRSGTTMLMFVFHLRPDTEVFDEHGNNEAFLDFRIRDFETLKRLICKSKARFACFKPICDSHLIADFVAHFPGGRFVWIYRDYRDVANSSLRKFRNPNCQIKMVCKGENGGGWLQDGVSTETAEILRSLYSPRLSEFDFACMVWWARNKIFTESNLADLQNLVLVKYEDMVTEPEETFRSLFSFLGMRYHYPAIRYIHRKSVSKHSYPEINPTVRKLCEDLMVELNNFAFT